MFALVFTSLLVFFMLYVLCIWIESFIVRSNTACMFDLSGPYLPSTLDSNSILNLKLEMLMLLSFNEQERCDRRCLVLFLLGHVEQMLICS